MDRRRCTQCGTWTAAHVPCERCGAGAPFRDGVRLCRACGQPAELAEPCGACGAEAPRVVQVNYSVGARGPYTAPTAHAGSPAGTSRGQAVLGAVVLLIAGGWLAGSCDSAQESAYEECIHETAEGVRILDEAGWVNGDPSDWDIAWGAADACYDIYYPDGG